ncbi:MAG: hypothetical protein H5T86_14740, partial [Armatimonadetes bacterium]|nr:hypothetical protein [Armatimonadota bacterium]
MIPLRASRLLVYREVTDHPLMSARAERLMRGIQADVIEYDVDDDRLEDVLQETGLAHPPLMGMKNESDPLVIFNYWRFDEPPELREKRRRQYPLLFSNTTAKFSGVEGFDWRDSGSPRYRKRTGLVCNPAWQIHSIGGCHFRCAYCSLGWVVNILMNVEDFMDRLAQRLEIDPFARSQKLWQYDNQTDTVCFEPEYGMTAALVEFFARTEGKWLELYVGKSDHVDFLLDLDHRGKTVCCWSLSARTQSTLIEWRTAPMEARIEAMAKCRQAGYPVRVRFSPIVPVRGWQDENREMIDLLFEAVQPDLVTFETLRFMDYPKLVKYIDPDLLDEEFLEVMEQA